MFKGMRVLKLLLLMLLCAAVVFSGCAEDAGSATTGTESTPVHQLSQNADGAWEIRSAEDLVVMADKAEEGATFLLMQDIDMQGAEWTPMEKFVGVFDGQGYTISNLTITQSNADGSMGFFCVIGYAQQENGTVVASEVKNLHLDNVNIVATEEAQYIGLLAGRTYGAIKDCTTVGSVTDNRTMLTKPVYVGAIAGSVEAGKVSGSVGYTTGYDGYLVGNSGVTTVADDVNGLASKMARFFAKLEEGSEARTFGIAGIADDADVDTTAIWQDTTNSTQYMSEALQERRRTVVDYMYEMATVQWTPSADMTWYSYKSGGHSTPDWYKGTVYYGIPYNHGSSSLERFFSVMDGPNSDGVYTTKSSLPASGFYFTDSAVIAEVNMAISEGKTVTKSGYVVPDNAYEKITGASQAGFCFYIGNDCSSSLSQAWRRVSAVSGTDFFKGLDTGDFYPSASNINVYGLETVDGNVLKPPVAYSKSSFLKDALDSTFKEDPIAYYEVLACTSMGDGIVGFSNAGGHTRMAAGDAMVVRDYKGVILVNDSYIITHEQGRPSKINGHSSDWTINFKYTFDMLTNYSDPKYLNSNGKSTIGVRACYYPFTMTALQEEDTPAATPYVELKKGAVRSNFAIISTTCGSETVYTGIAQTGHRTAVTAVNLAQTHKGIKAGDTVKVLLSDGKTYEVTYE